MKKEKISLYIEQFLAYRHLLGYTAPNMGRYLKAFERFLSENDHHWPITMELMRSWATGAGAARRWLSLRKLFEFCSLTEPNTVIPGKKLGHKARPRVEPYIYDKAEINALLSEALSFGSSHSIRGFTYATYFGLIAATGMRPSEAIRLMHEDIHWQKEAISIRDSKRNHLRIIPVHSSVIMALEKYRDFRIGISNDISSKPFFISNLSLKPLNLVSVEEVFRTIRTRAGVIVGEGRRQPRIHDLRHTFACNHLLRICKQRGNAESSLLSLSVYLGHTTISDTYWYLTGTPELFQFAARKFKRPLHLKEANHA